MSNFQLPQPYEKTNGCTLLAVIPSPYDKRFVVVVCYRERTENYVVAMSRLPLDTQWMHGDYDIPTLKEALQIAWHRAKVDS